MDLVIRKNKNGEVVMTSLELAELIEKRHDNIVRDIRSEIGKLGDNSLLIFEESNYENRGKKYPMYILNKEGVQFMASTYDSVTRLKVIQHMNKLETQLREQQPKLPTTYLEALEELVVKEKMLIEQKPKVDYYDKVLQPNNLMSTSEVAKDLGMSAIKLNKILNELGIQYKKGKTWMLYSKYEDKVPEYADYHIGEFGQNLKWTEKGREWIISLIKN